MLSRRGIFDGSLCPEKQRWCWTPPRIAIVATSIVAGVIVFSFVTYAVYHRTTRMNRENRRPMDPEQPPQATDQAVDQEIDQTTVHSLESADVLAQQNRQKLQELIDSAPEEVIEKMLKENGGGDLVEGRIQQWQNEWAANKRAQGYTDNQLQRPTPHKPISELAPEDSQTSVEDRVLKDEFRKLLHEWIMDHKMEPFSQQLQAAANPQEHSLSPLTGLMTRRKLEPLDLNDTPKRKGFKASGSIPLQNLTPTSVKSANALLGDTSPRPEIPPRSQSRPNSHPQHRQPTFAGTEFSHPELPRPGESVTSGPSRFQDAETDITNDPFAAAVRRNYEAQRARRPKQSINYIQQMIEEKRLEEEARQRLEVEKRKLEEEEEQKFIEDARAKLDEEERQRVFREHVTVRRAAGEEARLAQRQGGAGTDGGDVWDGKGKGKARMP